jgi:hypothetical protein
MEHLLTNHPFQALAYTAAIYVVVLVKITKILRRTDVSPRVYDWVGLIGSIWVVLGVISMIACWFYVTDSREALHSEKFIRAHPFQSAAFTTAIFVVVRFTIEWVKLHYEDFQMSFYCLLDRIVVICGFLWVIFLIAVFLFAR